jgi:hypothetical protein
MRPDYGFFKQKLWRRGYENKTAGPVRIRPVN